MKSMSDVAEIITETTGGDFPAHTYYLNEAGKLVGFKKVDSDTVTFYNKGMAFYKKGRKFKKEKIA